MPSKNTILWTIVIIFSLINESLPYEKRTYEKVSRKYSSMAREVHADGESKCRSVDHIKRYFETSTVYQLGALIFNTRLLVKRMIHMYTVILDTYTTSSFRKQFEYMLKIQRVGTQVDNMVQMVLEYELEDPSGRLYGRSGSRVEPDESDFEELALITKKRKEFLLRKKKEWAMLHGYDIKNLTQMKLFGSDRFVDGFESEEFGK